MSIPRNLLFSALLLAGPAGLAQSVPAVSWQTIRLDGTFYAEGAGYGDLDGDGAVDLVSGPWIYYGPDFSPERRSAFYEPKPYNIVGYSDNFFAYTRDFDADGDLDILVLGFPGKDASWFENPGRETLRSGPWARHRVLEPVDNESPLFADLTGDGRPEIVCSQNGVFGFAGPDGADPRQPWAFRPITPPQSTGAKFTHGLGIGDVNGDGRPDLLEKNAWWEQPASLEGNPLWKRHLFAFSGPGGAQMFADDLDGDGDQDIVTSLAAHGHGLAWYEQVERDGKKGFERRLIMGATPQENPHGVAFSQPHAVALVDIDGDGVKDIVTGKRYWAHNGRDAGEREPAVLYWFKTVREKRGDRVVLEFLPCLIDNDSGVGTDVTVGDVNGDGLPDVLVANKKGTFVHLQKRDGTPATAAPRRPVRKPFAETGLTAAEAVQQMSLTEGFRARVIAAEPDVTQPIAMAIDERGRLWVAEAHAYPIRQPEGEGRDRLLIFADEDGDGSYETRKVFADDLNLVSGLEVGFGGVWVGAAPHLLFIPDADRDDVPDGEPQVLLDGWGYQDTHETLNSFVWGPDGWLYGCHGVFTHSKVGKPGTPEADRVPLNAGVWRYHPVRHRFEVFAHGTSNPWGLDFDEQGEAYVTACVIPHLFHMLPGGRYHRQGGQHFNPHTYDDIKTIADHAHYAGNIRDHAHWGHTPTAPTDTLTMGGGHAHCGLVIYQGDQFPAEFRGQLIFTNLHGHGLISDFTVPHGSGRIGRHGPDFLHTNDRWAMPIDIQVTPDGGLVMIDWYDQQNCHRRDAELWDRTNGRIYAIEYGEPQRKKAPDLSAATDDDLVAALFSRNDWEATLSRRVLQERAASEKLGAETVAALIDRSRSADQPLRALWALLAIDRADEAAVTSWTQHADESVRAWAVRAIDGTSAALNAVATGLAPAEASPVVRRELASLLQRLPSAARWDLAAALLARGEDATDHNIPLLLWYGVEPLVPEAPERALTLAGAAKIPLVRQFIYRRLAHEDAGRESLLTQAARGGNAVEMLTAIDTVLQDRASAPMPQAWEAAFTALAASKDAAVAPMLERLATKFGDRRMLPRYRETLADDRADPAVRENALASLVAAKDAESVPVLQQLAGGAPSPLRARAIRALGAFTHDATPEVLLGVFDRLSPAEKADAASVLASNAGYARSLLAALAGGRVPRGAISAFTARQIRALGDEALNASLEQHWGKVTDSSDAKKAELERYRKLLTPDFLAKADLGNGRALYNQTCYACHTLFGEGNAIGPDITGGNRQDLEFLLENILDPSSVVGGDYQLTLFTMKDGRVVSGMPRGDNENAVRVALLGAEEQLLPKADIAKRETVPVSMMPEGILAPLKDAQVRDLIAYLQSPTQVRLAMPGEILFEGESLKVVKSTGNARPQAMGGFKAGKWSGDTHLWWVDAKPGDELVLEFEVPSDGVYALATALTKARDYGIVTLSLDGAKPLLETYDLYHPDQVVDTGELSLGEHPLTAGRHTLNVKITGANPAAVRRHMVGIDYLRLLKK
ncbi:MAG: VCBS repeat-containing protein [Verrucomicrobiales bacterium]|nr:VCBS repeat-containing protein [Verrucomicrobiales bacterium]